MNRKNELEATLGAARTPAGGHPPDNADSGSPGGLVGTSIGRYVVLSLLGQGGMGAVYEAFDPQLERRVALKLLHADFEDDQVHSQASTLTYAAPLRSEAKALAQLDHPNVVTVYDVGSHGGQAYLAMELLRGQDLRIWLDRTTPRWQLAVATIAQVADGLNYVHNAGLVHRDIKPANIFVQHDGTARIVDFGIVQHHNYGRQTSLEQPTHNHDCVGTAFSAGTPAYMSPEQLRGRVPGPRSDQFSLAVTLYEAIAGVRPFVGQNRAQLSAAIEGQHFSGQAKFSALPRDLRRVLERSLAHAPEERFPDLADFAEQLRRLLAKRSERLIHLRVSLAGAAIMGVCGLLLPTNDHARHCGDPEGQWRGIWDAEVRSAGAKSFRASALTYATSSWNFIERNLDARQTQWNAMYSQICAFRGENDATDDLDFDRQMRCLAIRRITTRSLTHTFSRATAETVDASKKALAALPRIGDCEDVATLRATVPLPLNPDLRGQIHQVRSDIAKTAVLGSAGEHAAAERNIERLRQTATRLGHTAISAEIELLAGQFALGRYRGPAAKQALRRAVWLAEASGHDYVAARALIGLVFTEGYVLRRPEHLEALLHHGRAHLDRLGTADELLYGLHHAQASAALLQGDLDQANTGFLQALAAAEADPEMPTLERTLARNNVAVLATRLGDRLGAIRRFTQIIDTVGHELGPEHPELMLPLLNRGKAMLEVGRWRAAHESLQRARNIVSNLNEPGSRIGQWIDKQLASHRALKGQQEWALQQLAHCIGEREQVFGDHDPQFVDFHGERAHTLTLAGQLSEARKVMTTIIERLAAQPLPPGELDDRMQTLAETDIKLGQYHRAEQWLAQHTMLRAHDEAIECDRYGRARVQLLQGIIDRELGRTPQALHRIRRATEAAERCTTPDSIDNARFRQELAKSLADLDCWSEARFEADAALSAWHRAGASDFVPVAALLRLRERIKRSLATGGDKTCPVTPL